MSATGAVVIELAVAEDFRLGSSTTSGLAPQGATQSGTEVSIAAFGLDGANQTARKIRYGPGTVLAGQSFTFNTDTFNAITNPNGSTGILSNTVIPCQKGDFVILAISDPAGSPTLSGLVATADVYAANKISINLYNPTTTDINISGPFTPVGPVHITDFWVVVMRPRI